MGENRPFIQHFTKTSHQPQPRSAPYSNRHYELPHKW